MTITTPLVSVIIPYYATEGGKLRQAIDSVLTQTVSSIELVVVDDASPVPAAPEVPNDKRIKLVKHSQNRGGGIARNTGVENATGTYVAFLDFDDVWFPSKIAQQIEKIEEMKIQFSSPVIYSKCIIVDEYRRYEAPKRAIRFGETVGNYLFCEKNIIQTSGIFLERRLALQVGFDKLIRHQDYQYCLSLEAAGGTFHMLDGATYEFRQVPKQNDYRFSARWLDQYRDYLSEEAQRGFKSLVILRSMVSSSHYFKAASYAMSERLICEFAKWTLFRLVKLILGRR